MGSLAGFRPGDHVDLICTGPGAPVRQQREIIRTRGRLLPCYPAALVELPNFGSRVTLLEVGYLTSNYLESTAAHG